MPRRYGVNTRLWVYRYLVLRDGEQCARCFETPTTQNKLDIDHIDGDHWNHDPDNLRLLCRSCNVALENSARPGRSPDLAPSAQKERERAEGKAATRVVREAVDYRQGEASMQANFLFEVDFRKWLLEKVQDKGGFPKQDAINAGAEVVGCSPSTTTKYLSKLTSSEGPLQEVRDMLGETHLVLKEHLKEKPRFIIDLDNRTDVLKHRGDNEGEEKLDTVPDAPDHLRGNRLPL